MPGFGHDYGHGYGHETEAVAPPPGTVAAWGTEWGAAWAGLLLPDPWGTIPWGGATGPPPPPPPPPPPSGQEAWYLPPVILAHRAPHYLNRFDRIGIPRSHQYRQFLRNYVDAGQVVGDTPEGANIYGWVGGRWNGPLSAEQIAVIDAAGQGGRIARVATIGDLPPDLENDYGTGGGEPITGVIENDLPSIQSVFRADLGIAATIVSTLPMVTQRIDAGVSISATVVSVLPMVTQEAQGTAGGVAGTISATLPSIQSAVVGVVTVRGTITSRLPMLRSFLSQAPLQGNWGSQNVAWGDTRYNWRGDHIP